MNTTIKLIAFAWFMSTTQTRNTSNEVQQIGVQQTDPHRHLKPHKGS